MQHTFDALSGKWKTIGRDEDPTEGLTNGLMSEFSEYYNHSNADEDSANGYSDFDNRRGKKVQYVSVMHFAKPKRMLNGKKNGGAQ